MRLSELLSTLPPELAMLGLERDAPDDDPVIRGLAYDSRAVSSGDLFFALRGADFDGHAFLGSAIELGAVALVVEELPERFERRGRPVARVPDSRRALAPISTHFFGNPARELRLVGITGTNGKTSTSYLIETMLKRAGARVGLIGTIEVRYADERRASLNTTPESYDLQRILRNMRTREIDAAVMEVSSHGLQLGRVEGCSFCVGAVTNVTQDHLDFHGSMQEYRASKALLFERYLAAGAIAVVNLDDPSAQTFLDAAERRGARSLRTSRNPGSDAEICLEGADVGLDGTRAGVRLPSGSVEVALPLLGDFNLENMLVACGVGVALGLEPNVIAEGIAACPQVPGRVEIVSADVPDAPTVVVDYAHTPDAVEKLLATLRPLTSGRVVTVFGCGGDRDRGKRPLMAEAVARFSDRVVATSDNPRGEDPLQILADVESGLGSLHKVDPEALAATEAAYTSLVDRREAIEAAIGVARPGDMVVIAGKGHEDYQIIGRERLPFDDRDEALRALQAREPR